MTKEDFSERVIELQACGAVDIAPASEAQDAIERGEIDTIYFRIGEFVDSPRLLVAVAKMHPDEVEHPDATSEASYSAGQFRLWWD